MIVVTGGAGFIGSNIVAGLEAAGHPPVSVIDQLGSGEKWKNLRGRELDEIVAPVDAFEFLDRRKADVTYVFHMGAVTATTETDADLVVDTNYRLSQAVWEWCAWNEVPLVYASSAATYGDGSAGFSDDSTPEALARFAPLNPYGWSKHLFDRWVARQVEDAGPVPPQWAGLKFFNVYGPHEYHKGGMMSHVTRSYPAVAAREPVTLFRSHRKGIADGEQRRDFVYVKDCVRVMLWLMDHPEVSGLFNLGTGRAQTWLELMEALHAAAGVELNVNWRDTPAEIRDGYQYFTEADMARLREAGYTDPFRSVAEGVGDYVAEHLASGDLYL